MKKLLLLAIFSIATQTTVCMQESYTTQQMPLFWEEMARITNEVKPQDPRLQEIITQNETKRLEIHAQELQKAIIDEKLKIALNKRITNLLQQAFSCKEAAQEECESIKRFAKNLYTKGYITESYYKKVSNISILNSHEIESKRAAIQKNLDIATLKKHFCIATPTNSKGKRLVTQADEDAYFEKILIKIYAAGMTVQDIVNNSDQNAFDANDPRKEIKNSEITFA